jgi:hypothetical protein
LISPIIQGLTGLDSDVASFFARVTAAGGSLTVNEQIAVNQLVLDLKANNIWNSMLVIYPMVGASASACAQNLKSSSFSGTFSGGWTFASTGVTPNGTNGYMNSSLVPSTSLTQNSAHISGYSRTDSLSGGLFGSYNTSATNGLYTNPKFTGNQQQSANNSSPGSANTSTNSNGFWINSRIVSTTFKIYRNSSIFQTSSSNSTGLTSYSIYIGGINAAGTIEYGNREVAFASIGTGLSDTDASNLYTVVQAFQTSLSRQV